MDVGVRFVLLTVCFESGYRWLYAYILALEFIEVAEIGLGSIFRRFDVMDKYRRVEKSRPAVPIGENEVRITAKGMPRNYVTYAITLVEEKGASDIILKAMGRAISNAVTVAEILKRRIPGLHQTTEISSADVNYMWEPLEEGLSTLETTRHVSMIAITLSRRQLNTSSAGYPSPLHADQLEPLPGHEYEGEDSRQNSRGRGRGRRWATGRAGNVATLSSQNGDTSGYNDSLDNGWNRRRGRGRGWATGRAGNVATPGPQNGYTSGYYNDLGNGWNQDRGRGGANYNNHRTNALDSSSRRIGGSGRFGYTGNIRAYGIDNREAGRRGRGRGRGSFGGGNQNEREVSPGVGQGQSST